jgi:hypothetical protein
VSSTADPISLLLLLLLLLLLFPPLPLPVGAPWCSGQTA